MVNITVSLCDMEFESLRADNRFKMHPDGKNLFMSWRSSKRGFDDNAMCKTLEITPEALKNQRRRLNRKILIDDGLLGKDIKKKHIKKVRDVIDKIKEADDSSPPTKNENEDYALKEHIADVILLIGGPITENWMEILLYVSKYLFINEVSDYMTVKTKIKNAVGREQKMYYDVADKKIGNVRDMIHDYIGQWGTLHTQAITETLSEQDQKITKLAEILVGSAPDKMLEVVDILDGEAPNAESEVILADIMKGIAKAEADAKAIQEAEIIEDIIPMEVPKGKEGEIMTDEILDAILEEDDDEEIIKL